MSVDEMYELLKENLRIMRESKADSITFSFEDTAQIFQFVCLMKQAKELMTFGE